MNNLSMDLHAESHIVTLDAKAFRMDFDNLALAYAEQVYREQYGRPINAAVIIDELFEASLSAVMAVSYGAMRSGGEKIDWQSFAKKIFTYTNYPEIFNVVSKAVSAMFAPGEVESGGAEEKNGTTHGGN